MPNNTFFKTILEGAIFGIAFFAAFWAVEKIHEQNEEIEEISSRLQDCEEKLSQLKK